MNWLSLVKQHYETHINALRRHVSGQLVIQFTDQCNARCPQCGMRVTEPFKRSKLAVTDVKTIINQAAQVGVKVISFTGGEPFIYLDDLVELIHYAKQAGITFIRTGTNGFLFKNPEAPDFTERIHRLAKTLADTPLRNLWISIDSSCTETHEAMRGFNGSIAGIKKALPILHHYGIYPSANLGINWNISQETQELLKKKWLFTGESDESAYLVLFEKTFQRAFQQFYSVVIDMGFTMVNTCYPMSVESSQTELDLDAVYAASSTDDVVRFSQKERHLLFKVLMNIIPQFRSKIRIFSPLCSLYSLMMQYIGHPEFPYPCRGGIEFFFIDAKSGNTYPCGYRGNENLGKFGDIDWKHMHCEKKCIRCDWECFRDPSELLGPVFDGLSSPLTLMDKYKNRKEYYKIWLNDVLYMVACDFFNGRRPPDFEKLKQFSKKI
ncbi:MAG: radical SAM protein [Desulfobacterales bacterium]|nr:radical SAM protein [Desulfobacterales bacterium]